MMFPLAVLLFTSPTLTAATGTDLEQKCANVTSYSATWFVNGVCYVYHGKDGTLYQDAKVSCNDINGYNGHLPHVSNMAELSALNAIVQSTPLYGAWLGIERLDTTSSDLNQGWYLTTPTDPPVPTTFLPWSTINPPNSASRVAWVFSVFPGTIQATNNFINYPVLCRYDNKTATTTTTPTISSTTTTKPITTTTTTTSTTTTTISRAACTTPLTTTAGGTGTTTATTYAERITSTFNHYRFGYFKNTCYWLDQLTVTFSKCLNMCHENNLCFGFSYNAGTSDCQLLAIIASASPYWFELTADKQYETVVRE
uniref:C-type lectin domain-containing protein n=1 Tax=Plectus sambesii TaxID=2011161 RepID=A0A914VJ02_9BILA